MCGASDRARSLLDLLVRDTYLFDRAATSDALPFCVISHVSFTLSRVHCFRKKISPTARVQTNSTSYHRVAYLHRKLPPWENFHSILIQWVSQHSGPPSKSPARTGLLNLASTLIGSTTTITQSHLCRHQAMSLHIISMRYTILTTTFFPPRRLAQRDILPHRLESTVRLQRTNTKSRASGRALR